MKKNIYLTLLIIVILLPGCSRDDLNILTTAEREWLESHKNSIVISCDPGWPPFEYVENGEYTGFSAEYISLIQKKIGIKFKFRPYDSWKDVMTGFKEGKIDIVPSIGEESTRAGYMIFTKPYYAVSTSIIVNTKEKGNITLGDLRGRSVGVVQGYDTISTYVKNNYPEIKVVFVTSTIAGLHAVSEGMIDAMIESPGVATHYIEKEGLKNLRFAGDGEQNWILRMGIKADYTLLRDILNKAIASIPDSERDAMLSRWGEVRNADRSTGVLQVFRIIGQVVLCIILAAVIFRFRQDLKKVSFLLYSKKWYFLLLFVTGSALLLLWFVFRSLLNHDKAVSLSQSEKEWLGSIREIRFCPNPSAPPLSYFDENSNFNGLTNDYIKEFEEFTGSRFTIIRVKSYAELLNVMKRGEADVAGPVQKTPERDIYLNFTDPYVTTRVVIFSRIDSPDYSSPEKLKGLKICITDGYSAERYLSEKYPYLKFDRVPDDFMGLLRVSSGEKDAMVADYIATSYILKKEGISNIRVSGDTGFSYRLSFAVNKKLYPLAAILDKAIARVDESKNKEITKRWVANESSVFHMNWTFLLVAGGTLIFFIIITSTVLAWNISLKKNVRLRTLELEQALKEVKTLQGFLPICANCKKIRNDTGYWTQIEEYIEERSDAKFSHGICPDCANKLYPGLKNTKRGNES